MLISQYKSYPILVIILTHFWAHYCISTRRVWTSKLAQPLKPLLAVNAKF